MLRKTQDFVDEVWLNFGFYSGSSMTFKNGNSITTLGLNGKPLNFIMATEAAQTCFTDDTNPTGTS